MAESMPRDAQRVQWRWIVLAAAIGVLLFATTAITQGTCYDSSDPAASYCTSGMTVSAATAPFLWGGYVLLAGFLGHLAVRRRSRR